MGWFISLALILAWTISGTGTNEILIAAGLFAIAGSIEWKRNK